MYVQRGPQRWYSDSFQYTDMGTQLAHRNCVRADLHRPASAPFVTSLCRCCCPPCSRRAIRADDPAWRLARYLPCRGPRVIASRWDEPLPEPVRSLTYRKKGSTSLTNLPAVAQYG